MRSSVRSIRRLVITVLGFLVLGVGLVMLIAPGPGLLTVSLGLLILGVEYAWARRRWLTIRHRAWILAEQTVANRWSAAGTVAFGLVLMGLGTALVVIEELPLAGWTAGVTAMTSGAITVATVVAAFAQHRRRTRVQVVGRVSSGGRHRRGW